MNYNGLKTGECSKCKHLRLRVSYTPEYECPYGFEDTHCAKFNGNAWMMGLIKCSEYVERSTA